MALAAMVDPLRIGVTVLVISRPRPVLQLLAFWLGGLAMGLLVGLGALFLLQDVALELMRNMPAAAGGSTVGLVQIGIGVLAVLIAALIAMGFPRRSGAPRPKNSAISRLTARVGRRDSGRVAVGGVPGRGRAGDASAVRGRTGGDSCVRRGCGDTVRGALIVYHLVVLAFAEIPLLGSLVAPAKTYSVMLRLHDWVIVRRRQLAAVIIATIGAFLFINGVSGI